MDAKFWVRNCILGRLQCSSTVGVHLRCDAKQHFLHISLSLAQVCWVEHTSLGRGCRDGELCGMGIVVNNNDLYKIFWYMMMRMWNLREKNIMPREKVILFLLLCHICINRGSSTCMLPHQVKTQYLHFRFHANYCVLPEKIPDELSRRSKHFNN